MIQEFVEASVIKRMLFMLKVDDILYMKETFFKTKSFFNFNLNVSVNDLIGHTARLSSPEFYSNDRGVRTQGFTFLSLRDSPQGLLAPI